MTLPSQSREKFYVIGFLSAASLAALIYVIWGPKVVPKARRKGGIKKGSCPGLLNQGNSCFLNAVLQACATSPAFRHWLGVTSQSPLITSLAQILRLLNNESDEVWDGCGNPYDVIDALREKRWVISTEEQDAHELFSVLGESLDEDRVRTAAVLPLLDVQALLTAPVCEHCQNRWGTKSPALKQDAHHTYQGLLSTRLQCQYCHYTCPIKYDAFDCLSLSLPSRNGVCDLNQLLASFIKPEIVEGVDCESCTKKIRQSEGELTPARKAAFTKQTFLGKVSQSLCLHVQRTTWLSNGMACKRSDHVTFPEYLCMDGYTTNTGRGRGQGKGLLGGRDVNSGSVIEAVTQGLSPASLTPAEPRSRLYRLNAVIEHLGDVTSGHFVTYRRAPFSTLTFLPSQTWLYTSDVVVRRTTWAKVQACSAYMLFYERI